MSPVESLVFFSPFEIALPFTYQNRCILFQPESSACLLERVNQLHVARPLGK